MARFPDYKKLIDEGKQVDFEELSSYVDSLIFSATFGTNRYFRRYCLMYSCIQHSFEKDLENAMCVSLTGNKLHLSINPILCIKVTENEDQILFIFAHEMKHLLYNHLEKHQDMLEIDVVSQLMNMALDCEVNTSLAEELSGYPKSIPTGLINRRFICNLCNVTSGYLSTYLLHNKYGTPADCIFELINRYMKKTLGYDADEILYRCKIQKTTFAKQVFLVACGQSSSVFKITDDAEAIRFCRILCKYFDNPIVSLLKLGDESNGSGMSQSSFDLSHIISTSKDLYDILLKNDAFNRDYGVRGDLSGIRKEIEKVDYKSEISWQGILRNTCSQLSEECRYSKKRINRRQPYRLELSGKVKEPRFTIVVGVDNSASISNDEYNYFMSELYSILKNYNCVVHVINFTGTVESKVTLSTKREVSSYFKTTNSNTIMRYNGGTFFQPVFDCVNKDKSICSSRTLVIMFTDGEGEDEVDFGNCKRRMWVLVRTNGKKSLSCPELEKNMFPIVKLRRKSI